MQIYFRKLGGVVLDTPDLGPVTKLGMGRRQGKEVFVPKAAAALPSMGAGGAEDMGLAAELGGSMAMGSPLPTPAAATATENASPEAAGGAAAAAPAEAGAVATGGNGSAAVEAPKEEAKKGFSDGDEEIIGGLTVAQSEMEGVAQEELDYLSKRSKRKIQTA